MHRMARLRIWDLLLASTLVFAPISCGVDLSAITRTLQPPTPVPQYIHYIPPEAFNVHLEFDYPGYWVLRDGKPYTNIVVISLDDPRYFTLPTPSSDGLHPPPSDFGSILISITPRKPGQTPKTEVELHKKGYIGTDWRIYLDDYETKIDGVDASVLEYQIQPAEYYPSTMFERRIFFVIDDQLYEIIFTVAEKERGGEFEQGYEYFFNSLRILP